MKNWAASSLVAGLVAVILVPSPAFAAQQVPTAVAPAAIQEYEISSSWLGTTSVYGALQPEARRIVIGQNTSVVQFDPGIPMVPGSYLMCGASDGVFGYFSYDDIEWNAEPVHSFAITPGVIPAGASYTWTCREGEEESDTVTWVIVAEDVGPETLVLQPEPAKLVSVLEQRNYSGTDFETREVTPGDRVQISAPPNTWGRPGAATEASVLLVNDGEYPNDEGDDISLSPNGDLFSFTVPLDLGIGFYNSDGWVDVNTTSTIAGSATVPTRIYRSNWETRFSYPDAPRGTSETSLRLSSPIGISTRPIRAIVSVRTSDVPFGTGSVALYIDGKIVARELSAATQSTTVQFTVPKLSRGRHVLRAEFEQTQQHEGSTSRNVVLRILF